jgi:hypothetical protein
MSRALAPLLLLLLGPAFLAGCGGDDEPDASPSQPAPTVTVTDTPTDTSSPSESASAGSPSSSPTSAPTSDAPTGSAGGAPECGTPDLVVSVKLPDGGGSAGKTRQELVFSNEADHACSITGFPGVSYVAGTRQAGAAADRDESAPAETMLLEPGDTASSLLTVDDPGVYPDCQPVNADKIKIYPPDSRRAIVMRTRAAACANPDVHLLTVGPVGPVG